MGEMERTMDVIKGYVEVKDDAESKIIRYLEAWTERQRK